VTLVAGDVIILPTDLAQAAKDAGPYVVVNPGSASAKFVLSRPDWYATGSTQLTGQSITLGGEGTARGGSEWSAIAPVASFVVDTTDGQWYPAMETVVSGAATAGVSPTITSLYVSPIATVVPVPVTPGGTQGIWRISTQTAGKKGSSSLIATSSSGTDTSTVRFIVRNF
jgi:hypothetical protein